MDFRGFAAAAPELARFLEQQLAATHLCVLGTLRSDGWPRISPCEAYLVDGDLMLGMMWHSRKALDLLRDPRLTAATHQDDKDGGEGDLKLYGYALEVTEPARRRALEETQYEAIGWRPSEPYHLFAVDLRTAGFISFGKDRRMLRWSVEGGLETLRHPHSAG